MWKKAIAPLSIRRYSVGREIARYRQDPSTLSAVLSFGISISTPLQRKPSTSIIVL